MNASNKMHRNKLPGTLIFQNFLGEHPIPLCRRGTLLQHIIPQDRRYRDEIVLRLLYNFLLLHFFNLKTLFLLSNSQGRTRGGEPAMVLVGFEFCLLFYLTDLSLHVTAWLNENSTVAHNNWKTRTTQTNISVKKSENYCLKAKPWMGTSFPNFPYVI